MAEGTATAAGAGPDVNTAGNPTEVAMAYLQDEVRRSSSAAFSFTEVIAGERKL